MEEAGEPVRYLAMPQEELQLLFDELETVEDAKALAEAVRSERAALGEMFPVETFPRADFPGHPIQAIMGTSATAMMGIRRVAKREAEREAARIHAEAEAVVKSLEMAPSGH